MLINAIKNVSGSIAAYFCSLMMKFEEAVELGNISLADCTKDRSDCTTCPGVAEM